MIWVYIGLAVVLGVVIALAVVAAGRESHERGGVIVLDTPAARAALSRCQPGSHYFAAGWAAPCECGARANLGDVLRTEDVFGA